MDNLSVEELALQRKRFAHLSDDEFRFMLQQVEGRQRTRDKLPTFAQIEDWWYPVRLSCEQCSSEATASYKAQLLADFLSLKGRGKGVFTDLTGGYGVDTYFMSEHACEAHYVERNEDLCKIAAHNFAMTRPQVRIHHTDATHFLTQMQGCDVIYIDPARRDQHGGKVFRLEDCEPNVIELLPTLRSKSNLIIIKLSPMLDITQALQSLKGNWDVHIVAIKNEVKEVLLLSHIPTASLDISPKGYRRDSEGMIYAVNLHSHVFPDTPPTPFVFSKEEERAAECKFYDASQKYLIESGAYIYEPNAAIIKAGAFKLIAERYSLSKMAPNTHLYLADQLISDFPGRVWQIIESNIKDAKNASANILTRNYPLSPELLRKKLKIKDSDTHTVIGARLADKPTLFLCKKI